MVSLEDAQKSHTVNRRVHDDCEIYTHKALNRNAIRSAVLD